MKSAMAGAKWETAAIVAVLSEDEEGTELLRMLPHEACEHASREHCFRKT